MKTDEELLAAAEELHSRGELSVTRLSRFVGGGQRERLAAVVRRIRAAAASRPGEPVSEVPAGAEPELPACLRDGLARVAADVVRELAAVRATEFERARAAEAAASAQHDAAIRAAANDRALLDEDLLACEAEVEELRAEIERLTAELTQAGGARAAAEELRRSEHESHSRERLALTDALARAQEEVARQGEGRARAEAEAAATGATARAAAAELERVRHESTALRGHCEALLRQLGATETERDRALHDLHALVADSSPPEVPGSPRAARRRRGRKRVASET